MYYNTLSTSRRVIEIDIALRSSVRELCTAFGFRSCLLCQAAFKAGKDIRFFIALADKYQLVDTVAVGIIPIIFYIGIIFEYGINFFLRTGGQPLIKFGDTCISARLFKVLYMHIVVSEPHIALRADKL